MALLPSLFAEVAEEDLGEVTGQVPKVWEPVLEQTKGETGEGREIMTMPQWLKAVACLCKEDLDREEKDAKVRLAPLRGAMGRATYNQKKKITTVTMVCPGNIVGDIVHGSLTGGLLVVDRAALQEILARKSYDF